MGFIAPLIHHLIGIFLDVFYRLRIEIIWRTVIPFFIDCYLRSGQPDLADFFISANWYISMLVDERTDLQLWILTFIFWDMPGYTAASIDCGWTKIKKTKQYFNYLPSRSLTTRP